MNEELVKILKMIENKIITAEEGQKLIQAMETAVAGMMPIRIRITILMET